MNFIVKWPIEHDNALRKFFTTGMSFSRIAAAINARFPTASYSRNAAIGRAQRIGLKQAEKPTPKIRQLFTPEEIQLRCDEIVPRNLTVIELEPNDCRYPYGHKDFLFCGHPRANDEAFYCALHLSLCTRERT
jgi:GcrA cell cycle regulator